MEHTEHDMKISSDTVRRLRMERGWSQEQLATASGLGLRTIQRVEAEGKAARETRVCLAATFEVELTDLIEVPESDNTAGVLANQSIKRYQIALGLAGILAVPVALNEIGVIESNIFASWCLMFMIALGLYGGFGAYFTGASQQASRIKRYTQVAFIAAAIFCGFAFLAEDNAGIGIAAQVTVLALAIYYLWDYFSTRRKLS